MADTVAAVLNGPGDIAIVKRDLPPLGPLEATIAVKSTGLCGSDLHYYKHYANGDFKVKSPLVLGHEAAGEIIAVGNQVTSLRVGDRVAIEAGIPCSDCSYCRGGRYNLCPKLKFRSSAKTFPHSDGTLQSLINHPVSFLHKVPEGCSFEEAALAEPLSVVLHANRRVKISVGDSALVIGAGPVGLLACVMAAAQGVTNIVVADIDQGRVDFATKEGFAQASFIVPRMENTLENSKSVATSLLQAVGQEEGFNIVYECTGVQSSLQTSIHAARAGGTVLMIGMGTPNVLLPLSAAALREVDLIGVFRYANTYPAALSLLSSPQLKKVAKLVSARFPLNQSAEAFQLLASGKTKDGQALLKVMIGDY